MTNINKLRIDEQNKTWCPAIELNETNKHLILKAEVPGVEINQLGIHAENNSILIVGIHGQHKSQAEKELIPSQLHYGQLQCEIPLPTKIDIKKAQAELVSGVLTVIMPKASALNPPSI